MEDLGRYAGDPVGHLAPEINRELDRRVREGHVAEKDRHKAYHGIAIDIQQSIGGPYRILAKSKANEIQARFLGSPTPDKIKYLRLIEAIYDEHARHVLDEIEIPRITGHRLAAEVLLSGKDDKLPIALMTAADRDEADFKVDTRMKESVRGAILDSLGKTDYGRARTAAAKILSGHGINREDLIGLETMVFKRALSYMEKGVAPEASLFSAAKKIGDCFHAISDSDLGHVIFDRKHRPDMVAAGLGEIRRRLSETVANPEQALILQKEGRWVNLGRFFILAIPSTLRLKDKVVAAVPEAAEIYGSLAMQGIR
jgi:hypothetical protein